MKNKRIEFAYLWIVGRIFVSSFALFILFSTAYTATLYVGPGQPYTTIQAAVNSPLQVSCQQSPNRCKSAAST